MASWSCGHRRLREFTYVELATERELHAMQGDKFWAGPAARELRDRYLKCPACRTQDRRVRRAWTWVVVAFGAILLMGWRAGCR